MWRRILSQAGSVLLALALATTVWVVATLEENPNRRDVFDQPIPIEVINKPEGTALMGDITPTHVRLTISAPEPSWARLTPSSFRAFVDLTDVPIGEPQEVEIQVTCSDKWVRILERDPSKVTVRLEPSAKKEMEIQVRLKDEMPLGYYLPHPPQVTPSKATVSGPKPLVEQVTRVTGDFYLRGAKGEVEQQVNLYPRDERGRVVKGVNLEPTQAMVRVVVEQKVGFREVAVRAVLTGTVSPGYWISNISVEPSTVTLVGSPLVLAEIPGYVETVPLSVEGAEADFSERVPLALPEGVSMLDPQGVTIKVDITAIMGGRTVRRELSIQGLSPGLQAQPSPEVVDVILSGPLPKLQALQPEDIQVVLNLFGLEKGIHKVKPTVITPEGIKVESIVPETIEVEITIASFRPQP